MFIYIRMLEKIFVLISPALTAQNTKFSIKDFFSKCDQVRRKKSLMENSFFVQWLLPLNSYL